MPRRSTTRLRPTDQNVMMSNPNYPVVITAADHPTGLITARSLIDVDAHIIGLYRNRDAPACKSALWSELAELGATPEAVASNLIRISRRFTRKPLLLPIQDDMVQWVSRHRAQLAAHFNFHLPSAEITELLLDKAAFHRWAEANAVPVPTSYIVDNENALWNALAELNFKAIIKPYLKTEVWDRLSPADKVFKIRAPRDLRDIHFDLFTACAKLVVQEWIPGGDENVFFCLTFFDQHGIDHAYFTGRKLHQWPIACGSTAVAVSDNCPEIIAITKGILRRLGYKGLGSIEFKRNPVDGRYYLIEPTVGRNDLQSYVAVPRGYNFTRLAFEDFMGPPKTAVQPKKKKAIWIDENTTMDSLVNHPVKTSTLVIRLLKEMLLCNVSFAYFHPRDHGPFITLARRKWGRKLKRIQSGLIPSFRSR